MLKCDRQGVLYGNKSNKTFVGAIDNGTTSTRFLIFDQLPSIKSSFNSIIHTPAGMNTIPRTLSLRSALALAKHAPPLPLKDTRSAHIVRELKQKPGADELMELRGLPLSTYPSSTKVLWMLSHVDKVKKAYAEGRLAFGTVDTWLVYKLNGGVERNVSTCRKSFPRQTPRHTARSQSKLKGVKITGCLDDQSAALVGQCGLSPGRAKNTYGAGCFLLYNVGEKPVISTHGLLATVAHDFSPQGIKPVYALEGCIVVDGPSVKFLVNKLGFGSESYQISDLAGTVKDNDGRVFVTAFSGLFAPYWYDDVKGTIFGLTGYTEKGHIARATLEATCFQTKAILDAMEKDAGVHLKELAVDGCMSNKEMNHEVDEKHWLSTQTQSDIIQIPVDRPQMRETTAVGAAIAAGFAAKVWSSFDKLKEINAEGRHFLQPGISKRESDRLCRCVEGGWTRTRMKRSGRGRRVENIAST
ncbi:glycerol kinase [Cladophialophora bantiana CBS 173.52]|uniref:glycerol kinase n=1 Tax=Cladophialophora bantiana (strain ATCC 10958 / CBS 173.52 / CDC B-1940 / NIH 8579) TaxID=1442370 RepID=A0A0D2EYC4_CLAB1|nr:glycerol kinase [Cladophialophora bantiana CBS 173.52]KIW94961.1 glycerol kinase [Cladophialophora bantiana CBS 173.52]